MTKTAQERQGALQDYQEAQDAYYNSKLELMANEAAKEEQIKKQEQQAALRASERMEALLGFTGEIAKTSNKIYILEGADQIGALEELLPRVEAFGTSHDFKEALCDIDVMGVALRSIQELAAQVDDLKREVRLYKRILNISNEQIQTERDNRANRLLEIAKIRTEKRTPVTLNVTEMRPATDTGVDPTEEPPDESNNETYLIDCNRGKQC